MAQVVLTTAAVAVVGAAEEAAIGGAIAGALFVGAASAAGAYIDSKWLYPLLRTTEKPKDVNDTSFDNGAPCPHAIGRVRVPAQIIWASAPMYGEGGKKNKSSTGKITRHVAFAFHRGPIESTSCVQRVFANGTRIYDTYFSAAGITPVSYSITSTTLVENPASPATQDQVLALVITFSSTAVRDSFIDLFAQIDTGGSDDSEGGATTTPQNVIVGIKFIPAGASNLTVAGRLINVDPHTPGDTYLYEGLSAGAGATANITIRGTKTYYDTTDAAAGLVTVPTLTISDFTTGGQAAIAAVGNDIATTPSYADVTFYSGDFAQSADPLMASKFPLVSGRSTTPAHRGTAYGVFEHLDVTAWGGTIPTIEVLFTTTTSLPITTQTAVREVLVYSGSQDMLSALRYYAVGDGGTGDTFQGTFWLGPTPTTQKLSDLAILSQFNIFEGFWTNGYTTIPTLEITDAFKSTNSSDRTISAASATCREFGEQGPIEPKIVKTPLDSLPNAVSANYLKSTNNNLQATITHSIISDSQYSFVTRNEINPKIPFSLTISEAQKYVLRMFWDARMQKDVIELQLPPTYYDMYVGDIIDITLHSVRITARVVELEAGANGLIRVKGVLTDGRTDGQVIDVIPTIPTTPTTQSPLLLAIETKPLQQADVGNIVMYVAVYFPGTFPVSGFAISYSLDSGVSWIQAGRVRSSTYASYISSTALAGVPELVDYELISIVNQAFMPVGSSSNLSDATDGTYRYYIGGELIGVGNESDPNVTQLIRGMNASAASSKTAGALVAYLPSSLTGWLRIVLPRTALNLNALLQAVPVGVASATTLTASRNITGASLYASLPYGISSHRQANNQLVITCYMSGPRPAETLTCGHITMSEVDEQYYPTVEVVASSTDKTRLRILYGTSNDGCWRFIYWSADQRADYGTGGSDPSNIYMIVRTLGAASYVTHNHTGTNNYNENAN